MGVSLTKFYQIEDTVSEYEWRPDGVYFTVEDIQKYVEPSIEKNINFAIWLLQKPAITLSEKNARRYLMNVVNRYIEGGQ